MTDIRKHPILREISTVVSAIEACGASQQLTSAVVLASSLYKSAEALIDAQVTTKQLPPPKDRLTPADIDGTIVDRRFHKLPDTSITICELTLRNGAKVLGHNYGSIDPTKQDWAQGEAAAFALAREKVWELEGYLLRERLHAAR
ncbi:Gp49 family protein [Variovorax sp. LT1R20]|uniref:Gp49 family protein n=1 Tax=Variovorax sp. LT1R20 TaxID=3443729 RepID=UPI003F455785